MKKDEIRTTAWISLLPNGIVIGTANNFKKNGYFEIEGTRGNTWIFNIDEVLKLAKKSKIKENLNYALMIEKDVNSDSGLNVGFPLAILIQNIAKEFGDDAVIKLHKGKNNPDDRKKK